jgi:hypothetical protein
MMNDAYVYISLYLLCSVDVGMASIMPQIAFNDVKSACARVKGDVASPENADYPSRTYPSRTCLQQFS